MQRILIALAAAAFAALLVAGAAIAQETTTAAEAQYATDTDSNAQCSGAKVVNTTESTSATDKESPPFNIKGDRIKVTVTVTPLSSDPDSAKVTVRIVNDENGEPAYTDSQKGGTNSAVVNAGPGRFFVEVFNVTNASYKVVVEDCVGAGGGSGGGGGGSGGGGSGGGGSGGKNNDSAVSLNDVVIDDFNKADGVAFRCEQILEVSRGTAGRDQYNFSAARIDECRRRVVLDDTIPRKVKSLPNTGGSPLVLLAAGALLVSGLLAGSSVFRAGFAARRRR